METTVKVTYSAGELAKRLSIVVAVLVTCHVAVMLIHYRVIELPWLFKDLFDLDEEQSFGTWVSAALLMFAGYVLLVLARSIEQTKGSGHWYWRLLGLGFLLLSLDEVVGLHETLNTAIDISWTIPGAIVAGVVGVAFIPFLIALPNRTRLLFILAGAVYLGGALGVERASEWYLDRDLLDTLDYNLTTALEEGMEMGGVIILIYGVLRHIAGTSRESVSLTAKIAV